MEVERMSVIVQAQTLWPTDSARRIPAVLELVNLVSKWPRFDSTNKANNSVLV